MKTFIVIMFSVLSSKIEDAAAYRRFSVRRRSTLISSAESPSNYKDTSVSVKAIVGGLTSVANAIWGERNKLTERVYLKSSITPNEIFDGVVGDFERGYLFSGAIDAELYDEDCSFTDPTISFTGLSTFERNIASLKPILDRFVGNSVVVLYNCSLTDSSVVTRWRMSGNVKLPWNPRIELTGSTRLTFDPTKNGRIVSYFETWDIPASNALFQLLQPSIPIEFDFDGSIGNAAVKTGPTVALNVERLKMLLSYSSFATGRSKSEFFNALRLLEISSSISLIDNIDGSGDVASRVTSLLIGKPWKRRFEQRLPLSGSTDFRNDNQSPIIFTCERPCADKYFVETVLSRSEANGKGWDIPASQYDPFDQRSINLLVKNSHHANEQDSSGCDELWRVVYIDSDLLLAYQYESAVSELEPILAVFTPL